MEIWTSKEVADYIKLSYSRFLSILSTEPELLPPFFKVGKSYRWTKATVDKWVENQERGLR